MYKISKEVHSLMYYNTFPMLALAIRPWAVTLLIILAVLLVALFLLYRWGTKLQKRQEDAQSQMNANAQVVSMLVIDKKRMKLAESGLPKMVTDQIPKLAKRSKLPIVKVKIGPKILSMICDEKVFDLVPVKKEVKATISGIYIMDVKGIRGGLEAAPVKKKKFFQRMAEKAQAKVDEMNGEQDTGKKKKKRNS